MQLITAIAILSRLHLKVLPMVLDVDMDVIKVEAVDQVIEEEGGTDSEETAG